ncbi:MAG: ATP-binding cassette domain-containing protein [Rhodospirillaceae bacterium]|jgi:ABC-type iron transport system FetAB ATPase subunit|nr:ATP-binding cassette domain-containing protein [Rhodospirillaceae bacterium]MBT5242665.1 ATP-binding cassette domain-containing protein [Rhodospirillaceae bacterium]MBT5562828.1 ATP-binding cassette domain-containing protein [Rhodospirillaceae bacterium]MBT6241257.1 ATP-binding cassette domain-containing protein [Rhodospirillaceae bacterium]MBT7137104.1 ATP-binding cassette domain-containing protein [Rhodospirillaceae bacterium]
MLSIRNLAGTGIGPIDLKLAGGEVAAITGASGAGKSLLLRAIADLDPNEGEIMLDGEERSTMPAPNWRAQVAYVAAETSWWAERVGDHFEEKRSATQLLEQVGLGESVLDWSIPRVSTGEKQRLALVRSLVGKPRVLLLDEPTSALDATNRQLVEQLLIGRLGEGTSIIIVTHDPEQAKRLKAKRYHLEAGVLEASP